MMRLRWPASPSGREDELVSKASEDAHRRLLRARDLMDRGYARPLDVDELARVAVMARSHFIREFKRVFAETPYRYLQRRRVERAMFLLRHGTDTVTEVCGKVGFTSLGTFSRTFTAIVGLAPTAYREAATDTVRTAPTSFAMRWSRPAGYAKPRVPDRHQPHEEPPGAPPGHVDQGPG
jgi:AraC-like DNA-binding protein